MTDPLDRRDARPIGPVTLPGRLVRLVPLAFAHLEGLLAAATEDPAERYPFTVVPREPEAMHRWIDDALGAAAAGRAVPFATLDAVTGRVLGATRFGNLERWGWPDGLERRSPGGVDAAEIGWTWLSRRAQRTGANTEAKLLMLTHAFEAWRVHRLQLKADEKNARSRAAIERLGARFEGVLRCQVPAAEGGLRDTAVYSIVEAEWPAVRAGLVARLAR